MASATSVSKVDRELSWDPASIPPFPAIALKALKLMSGSDTSLIELCNLIRSDAAMSVAVLRMANSPLVAFSKNCTSVLQASMLLGFRRLRSVIITVGLRAYTKNSPTPLMAACWRHSVACAILAERTAKLNFMDNDFAYTAGILHDIGRIALATVMPQAYAHVIERGADRPQDLLQAEYEFCGLDHCHAGRSLVMSWNLPDAFMDVTSCHHNSQVELPGTASLIPASCALADALGFTIVKYRTPSNYAETLAEFPESVQKHFPTNAKELAAEILTEIKTIESA
jgi:HD-like signal output (HDOD) protein